MPSVVGWIKADREMVDSTKELGQVATIMCEITGNPTPSYVWFRNNQTIYADRDHLDVKTVYWGSRLKIKSVTREDNGTYSCLGFNDFGRANTSARFYVKESTSPKRATSRTSLKQDPTPNPRKQKLFAVRQNKGSLSADLNRVAGAKRDGIQQFGVANVPNSLPEIHYPDGDDSQQGVAMCQPYRGSACDRFIANTSIYVSSVYFQGLKEEQLTVAFMLMATSHRLSRKCAEFAIPAICAYIFSPCVDSAKPAPKLVCAEDCRQLEMGVCRSDFARAHKHHILGNILPDCSRLRLENTDCTHVGVVRLAVDNSHTCYTETGQSYRGPMSTTSSGAECEQWSQISRIASTSVPEFYYRQYPELVGNYCRNPGGKENSPWCFIKGLHVKEACAVPHCDAKAKSDSMANLVYIIIPGITVPVLVLAIMAIFCLYRRCQRREKTHAKTTLSAAHRAIQTVPFYRTGTAPTIPISSVNFLQEIGEGQFGKIYKGEIIDSIIGNSVGDTRTLPVVLKTLKDKTQLHTQTIFVRESEVMARLKHPNIVCLLGVCMTEEPVCMIFEYTNFGDLRNFLIAHSPHSDVVAETDGLPAVLSLEHMMIVAKQIACGMEYLTNMNFIHGDLAARNVLIGDNLAVKVCDFGLKRDVNTFDYYKMHTKNPLPVRWMPPEAIVYGTSSRESDIWSYGVVLWEIFSYGLHPYYSSSNEEVVRLIRERKLLPCPRVCPVEIHAVMLDCWTDNPRRRPTFTDIIDQYRKWESKLVTMTSTAAWVKRVQVQETVPNSCSPICVASKNTSVTTVSGVSQSGVTNSDGEISPINTTVKAPLSNQIVPALSMDIVKPPYLVQQSEMDSSPVKTKGSTTESVSSHQSSTSSAQYPRAGTPNNLRSCEQMKTVDDRKLQFHRNFSVGRPPHHAANDEPQCMIPMENYANKMAAHEIEKTNDLNATEHRSFDYVAQS